MAMDAQVTSGKALAQEYAQERRAFADRRDTATSLPSINHLTSEADEELMEWDEEASSRDSKETQEKEESQETQEKEESQQAQEEKVAGQAEKSKNAKKEDLSKHLACHKGPITTLMIQNLPCSVDPGQLADALDGLSYARTYDLLMMPTNIRSTGKMSNLGYGFVNFKDAADAESFAKTFKGYKFSGTTLAKVCTTQPAHVQGFEGTLKTFRRVKNRCTGSFMCRL